MPAEFHDFTTKEKISTGISSLKVGRHLGKNQRWPPGMFKGVIGPSFFARSSQLFQDNLQISIVTHCRFHKYDLIVEINLYTL